jgi:signal transduction histidine kinase
MSTTTAKDGTGGYYTDWGEGRDVAFSGPQGVHRRVTAEQLAEHAARLARKNEALEDFAALVAHDVKSSLLSVLMSDEPRKVLMRAVEIVDSILAATRADQQEALHLAADSRYAPRTPHAQAQARHPRRAGPVRTRKRPDRCVVMFATVQPWDPATDGQRVP